MKDLSARRKSLNNFPRTNIRKIRSLKERARGISSSPNIEISIDTNEIQGIKDVRREASPLKTITGEQKAAATVATKERNEKPVAIFVFFAARNRKNLRSASKGMKGRSCWLPDAYSA